MRRAQCCFFTSRNFSFTGTNYNFNGSASVRSTTLHPKRALCRGIFLSHPESHSSSWLDPTLWVGSAVVAAPSVLGATTAAATITSEYAAAAAARATTTSV
jgi:hypothetical protein